MKTFSAKAEQVQRKWHLIDAKDQVLGQVAVQAANLLRGKNKAIFTPHVDTGDYVIIINAKDVRLTGKKETDKVYTRFSGYIGGQKRDSPKSIRARHPERLLEMAVKGMIPHNRLGRKIYTKLRVFAGADYDKYENHKPEPYALA